MFKLYKMNVFSAIIFYLLVNALAKGCSNKKSSSKLICYYSKLTDVESCKCSHVILPANSDVKSIDKLRDILKGIKILITVDEFNQGLVDIFKSNKVDGIEIALKNLDTKNDINDFISTIRSKLGSDLYIILSVPAKPETLAKYYDFKSLSKNADLFVLQTAFLGASKNVTFHPSRLSGLWDMQNTDSIVDLVSGLGAPLSKLVITSPVQAFKFTLQSEKHTAPGSPAVKVQSITRDELCKTMGNGENWTLERDQDQAGPYIFSKNQWIAFEDATSIDIKAKYSRVRGLAGIAIKDASQDGGVKCESSILDAAFTGLSRQARAPRGAVLHSLEREILQTPSRPLDTIQVSPYRISRVIDVEGNVHVIRQDTRTEFECSRQGYFVHPRSCNRFYRCVKFDQLSDEFSVFEFDCPAGLAFDDRVEVCVWPGSLPHASACSGSSEIAPVPRQRFICPTEPGYYADPENCRWFFACLDHGKSPLSAYEFRCPFGLVFDESRLLCEWSWLVPSCGSGIAVRSEVVYGGSGSIPLDHYNGLGVLGVTALGGLQGPVEQTFSKVYSNVGNTIGIVGGSHGLAEINSGDQGYQINQNGGYVGSRISTAGEGLAQGNYGYTSAQVISGDAGLGGLSVKATQALQNSGQNSATSQQSFIQHHQKSVNLEESLSTGHGIANAGNFYYGAADVGDYGIKTVSGLGYTNGYVQSAGHQSSGADSKQSSFQFQRTNARTAGDNYEGNVALGHSNTLQQIINHNSQTSSTGESFVNTGVGNKYAIIGQGFAQDDSFSEVNRPTTFPGNAINTATIFGSIASNNVHLVNGLVNENSANLENIGVTKSFGTSGYGAKSQQSFVQYNVPIVSNGQNLNQAVVSDSDVSRAAVEYHGLAGSGYNIGTVGNINIVGGGYSAVGVVDEGIQISNNGEGSNSISSVTPSPISVTTATTVPTVTSVPVPALKVASGFESYKGGVVANLPELQYKVQRPNYYQSNINSGSNSFGIANGTSSFVNFISTTSSPGSLTDRYVYSKPTVTFVEEPVKTTVYKQPSVSTTSFIQQNLASVQPVINTQQQTIIVSTTATPILYEQNLKIKPALGSSYAIQNQDNVKTVFEGYDYPKPTIKFEDTSLPTVLSHPVNSGSFSYQKPNVIHKTVEETPLTIVQQVQPVVGGSFNYQKTNSVHKSEGYVYSKPSIEFQETPVATVQEVQPVVGGSFNYQKTNIVHKNEGYVYPRPSVAFEKSLLNVQEVQPVEDGSFNYQNTEHKSEGYVYEKPSIAFDEGATQTTNQAHISSFTHSPPSTVKSFTVIDQVQPVLQVQQVIKQQPSTFTVSSLQKSRVQPIVVEQTPQVYVSSTEAPIAEEKALLQPINQQPDVYSVSNIQKYDTTFSGYDYPKPSVVFEEKPHVQAAITSYNVPSSTVRPVVIKQTPQDVYVSSTVVPFQQNVEQPAPSVSYSYHNQEARGYRIEMKPAATFTQPDIQKTIVSSQPAISTYTYQTPIREVQPAVNTYQDVFKQSVLTQGYSYPQPAVAFEETPASVTRLSYTETKPAVVSSYSYTAPSTVRLPAAKKQTPLSYSYTAPSTIRPAVVSSYSYTGPTTVKPAVFVQPLQLIVPSFPQTVSTTVRPNVQKQPAVVSSYSYTGSSRRNPTEAVQPIAVNFEFSGYQYPKPTVSFIEEPVPIVTSYENRKPIEEVPFVAKKSYVTGQSKSNQQINNVDNGYVYDKPSIAFEERPIVIESYEAPVQKHVVSTTPVYQENIYYSTPKPILDYSYVQSTPKPTFASTIQEVVSAQIQPIAQKQEFYFYDSGLTPTSRPAIQTYSTPLSTIQTVTTSRPIAKYSFGSLDDQYKFVSTSSPLLTSKLGTVDKQYVQNYIAPVQVTSPRGEYLPARGRVKATIVVPTKSYVVPDAISPSRDYLPVRTRGKITSTPPSVSSTYLPAQDDYEVVSTRRPIKVVKVVTPKTIVKVNDFHPLLSAKLGAQCTCVSNTLRLRKQPQRVIVETEDDDDDGYVVERNNGGVVVENYEYEPQKIVDITQTPDIIIKSTTNSVEPAPAPVYAIRKKVRVRPATTTLVYDAPVTDAAELFVKKRISPAVAIVKSASKGPSDGEIVNAVRTGLKLVKQAAKEGAKEGTEEALNSRAFDRYGPGGWRSRNEKLQGTIDCQRAGLFRHPTECNKFYACRWDCTKNRYTLHVFNCPVHLTFDNNIGACNWPSQGPACLENTLLPSD